MTLEGCGDSAVLTVYNDLYDPTLPEGTPGTPPSGNPPATPTTPVTPVTPVDSGGNSGASGSSGCGSGSGRRGQVHRLTNPVNT